MARDRLHVVVRKDLSPAQQAVQAVHAAREFAAQFPEEDLRWYRTSNTLALLEVPDEAALAALVDLAASRGLRVASFHEEDLQNAMTAAAFEPAAKNLMRPLPCALQGV